MRSTLLWTVGLGLPLLTACAGAPRQLEPRTPPPREVPAVSMPNTPIAAGQGRVVLSTTDEPMKISARADTNFVPPGATVAPSQSGDLCSSPCVVDLPLGRYKLYMTAANANSTRGDVDELLVNRGVNYYVRAPGKFEPPEWLPTMPTVLIITGAILIGSGAVLAAEDGSSSKVLGGSIMVGGLGLEIAGGVLSYNKRRGTIQQGATTAWTVPAP
jgi:hypothetical protein